MGMNQTPSGERLHIGFFGKRNAGKSSLVNAVTGQELAIVSQIKGTTTDPVYKSMELLPLGPVVMIDTPGLDDEGELGLLRIGKARQVVNKTDIGVIVIDGREGIGRQEEELIQIFQKKEIPFLIVYNKMDLCQSEDNGAKALQPPQFQLSAEESGCSVLWVSATEKKGIRELKEAIGRLRPEEKGRRLLADLVNPGDTVVLVVPVDKAAPKGRLILPQQQAIRDILDQEGIAMVCQDSRLKQTLEQMKEKPKLVITDSQVFPQVDRLTPSDIKMTSFSVLFARYKGNLWQAVEGARALEHVRDGDKILISEGCTHHRQCGDIGTCKLPAMIRRYTGKEPEFSYTSGVEFPEDLSEYCLVIHCGGCMLTEREMRYRLGMAADQKIPMTNYGIIIAYMNGILERSLKPLI
ncbi:[FeFe] hydrogenase H-cluster maturation GTPase HydF [Lachnospiraceae bacterium 62-35]